MKKLLAFLLYFTLSGLLLANTGFFPNHPITVERNTIEICPDINDNNAMMPELIAVQESITAADVSVTVHITVKDFNNFVGISHMLVWDPSVLRIDQTLPSNSLTNLNTSISPFVSPGQFSARNDSTLGFSWIQFNPSFPQSLANGDTLYSIVFDVVGNIGSGTLLREFPDNERPPELVRPRNQLSIPSGNASAGIPYVGVNTIITTSSSGNNPPSVSFTSPFDGQNFVTGSTLNVTASASDSDGTVTGVEFFYDGISQGTDGLVPYQWSISNLAGGIHTLRVVATDNDGATSQSTITINVSSPNAPPTVSFITPNNGQTFNEGDNINVNVSASDSDGGITGVELFYDNISQGVMNTAPYQWTIFNLAAGTHNLRAEATDDDGAISQTAITINVNAAANIPPTVSFISPSNGQVFTAGDNLNIQASAGDSDGSIANVEFFYNNVSQGADNSSPYTWSISNLAAGTQTLQVIATDDDGATTQQTITITVNSISGLPGPVSDCITTRNFAVANSTINIGTYQATENITTTGSISINPSDEVIFQAGQSITLTEGFIAKPSAGSFTARIRPCTFVNNSPLVFFTQPLNADILDEGKDLVVTADASDPFGAVANVQFYFDGILQGTDNIAPYQWFVPSLTLGTHTLQVIVTDDMGATAQETITITVDNLNDAPTVFFTQPLDGDNLLTGSDIDVIASASDADGTITMVELFYDGVQQGIDNIVPYRWTIFDLAAGTHTLRVVATDDDGATAEETITISVSAPNTPPTISFVNPLDGDNFMDGDDLLVEATASDSDGSIANVQFIYDGVLQGTDNLNPYQWMLTNLTQGTHTLEVIATDDMGATANATATITVNTVTTPPTVSFVAPIDGEILAEGSNLSIEANATDSDGSIVGVQLFYDGILQGTDNTPAYQWIVPNLQIGTHTLQVVATDDNNATAQATVTITVNPVSFASDSGQQHTDNSVDMLAFVENSEADIAAAFVSNKTEYLTTNEEAHTMRMQPELIAVQNPAAPSDQQVTVNITANNLVNVVGVSHMLVWDPSVLRINRANPASNLTNLNTNISPAISTGQFTAVTDSTLGFSWIQFDVNQAQSLANGETLYSIVFDVVGAIGGGTLLREFPTNERPPELIRPRNLISIPSGISSIATTYTPVNTLIVTSNSNNSLPNLSFISPTNGQTFTNGASTVVNVSASDSDGSISGVEFFYDGVSQGTDNVAPYQWNLSNLALGSRTLRVVATDNEGGISERTITIEVGNINVPPAISFITPFNGQSFQSGNNLDIQINSSDADGTITQVEFFYDGVSQGTDNIAPYSWAIANLTSGAHTLRGVATDNSGATSEVSISISVSARNQLPTVSINSPSNGQTFTAGANLTVEASATDLDGNISGLEFFYDGISQGTDNAAPYQWLLSNLAVGTHNIQVIATDNQGGTAQQTISINVGVANSSPVLSILNPSNGQNFAAGSNLTVQANASDPDGSITGLEFFYDGVSQGTDNIAPYQWFLSNLTEGSHSIRIVATDNSGASTQQIVSISVSAANQSPTISIVTPTDGQVLPAGTNITIQATANDPDGSITAVEFLYDGISEGTDNVAPFQRTIFNLAVGTHSIQVIATDNDGATAQQSITITVNADGDIPPTVSFITPIMDQNFNEGTTLTVQANASDTDGTIMKVELYYDSFFQGADANAPYQWTIPSMVAGTHNLQIVATDNDGNTAKQTISIIVKPVVNAAPVVNITTPINGQNFVAGTSINIQASASDSDGTISGVELFYDGLSYGTDTSRPYQWSIMNLIAGTHTLQAVATDDDGTTSQQTITITVNANQNVPPTLSFNNPNDGQNFMLGANLSISVNASDSDGSVSGVELFYDGISQGTDNFAPYQWSIANLSIGTHNLQAIATDNNGATAQQSISIVVSADQNTAPTLSFSSPTDGQSFTAGTNLNVSVNASDSDGSVSIVEFFYDGISQGVDNTAPYSWSVANLAAGTHNLQAIATDDDGATAQQSISITVTAATNENVPPTISFSAPTDGQSFTEGADLTVSVEATDSDGSIQGTEFFYDGVSQGVDRRRPYEWSLTNLATGTHTLRAVTQDNDRDRSEVTISITVTSATTGNIPPSISFNAPMDGQSFTEGSSIDVSVLATDSDGTIRGTELFYDEVSQGVDGRSPYEWSLTNLTVGTHTLRAVTQDNDRDRSEVSISITVTSTTSTEPSVSFVIPTDGQTYPEGSDVPVEVLASDGDGSIRYVELFLDGVFVRRESIAPYEWALPNQNDAALKDMTPGDYLLEAVATDNDGNTSSASINFTILGVTGNTQPTISITAPEDGQNFTEGSTLDVRANAGDSDGTIANLELFYDGVSQGLDNSAPYRWTLPNLAVGAHTIQVVATDDDGASAQQSISITVSANANVVPSLSFTNPTNGQSFAENTNLNVDVNASDVDGTITSVELFYDGVSQGSDNTSPYQWVIPDLSLGSHSLQAIATDDDGATTEQTISITVTASNLGDPSVSFITPTNGQSYITGADVVVSVDATDDDGRIRYVDLYLNEEFVRREGIAPYEWGLSTQNDVLLADMSPGTYTLEAIATDNAGNTGSSIINFTIQGGGNNLPPIVTFAAPTDGQSFVAGSTLNVSANASDSDGTIASVELFYNNASIGVDNSAPYQWSIDNLTIGTHSLRAVATDNQGATSQRTISITVTQSLNRPPSLSFTNPTQGANLIAGNNLNVEINATDNDGIIADVELFYDDVSQGSDNNAPYQWVIANLSIGVHNLRAIATDDEGATSEQSISVNVIADQSGNPRVVFITPSNGQSYPNGSDVMIEVDATDEDGSIRFVDLFLNGEFVRREGIRPYEWGLSTQNDALLADMSPGTYTLEAIATDNEDNTSSETISFTVGNGGNTNTAPTVSFRSPANGADFVEGNSVNVEVNASDSDGTIASVEFFHNGASKGVDNTAPYQWSLNDLSVGTQTLRATATDNNGATTTQSIRINVIADNSGPVQVAFIAPTDGSGYNVGANVMVEVTATTTENSIKYVDLFLDGNLVRREKVAPYEWGLSTQNDAILGNMSAGSYTLEAVATDNRGNEARESITFSVGASSLARFVSTSEQQNQSPTISITTPENRTVFGEGDDIVVEAEASDSDGTITQVEFFYRDDNGDISFIDSTPPYTWRIKDVIPGNNNIRATAMDNDGNTDSETIAVTVNPSDGTPIVTIITPDDGDGFIEGDDLTVQASARDTDGTIRNIRLLFDEVTTTVIFDSEGTWTAATDPELANLSLGMHTVQVVAVDDRGNTGEKTYVINVVAENGGGNDNVAPSLSIDSPSDGQTFEAGASANVTVSASDSDGTVTGVELFYNGQSQGVDDTAPYEWSIDNLMAGQGNIRAVATDDDNASTEQSITINVNDDTGGGDPCDNTRTFTDADSPVLAGTYSTAQTITTEGTVSIQAEAEVIFQAGESITLNAGFSAQPSGDGSFTARIAACQGTDNISPSVSFVQPNDGDILTEGTDLSVQVSASDSDGSIASVEFFYDGVSQGTDNSAPYQWTVNNLAVGTYDLRAVATDDEGATASTTISITVEADIVDDGTPIVTISTPEDGAVFPAGTDLTVSASATDSDGTIRNIRLLLNGSTVRVIQAASGTWDANTDPELANLEAGNYELKVVAVDDAGNRGEDVHNIIVRDGNQAPSLSFVNPTDGQDFPEGSDVVVEVSASDVDGSIDSVQLFLNGTFYRTEGIAPYTWGASDQNDPEFMNMSIGTYMLEAIAFDNEGASTSETISFTVSADNGGDNQAPIVSFDQPNDGQTFTEGTNLNVQVSASDSDGSIASVEFFYDGVSQGTDNSAPYQWTVNNLAVGTFSLQAVATDDEGATASTTISITVEADIVDDGTPIVTISTPEDGAVFSAGTDLTVSASATDSDGMIRNIRLLLNGSTVRVIQAASGTWDANTDPELANLEAGNYELKVVAVDDAGNRGEDVHNITVRDGNQAPSLSFVNPTDGQDFPEGSDVVVEVSASDVDGSIDSVQLFLNGVFYRTEGIAPYTWGASDQNDPEFMNMSIGTYMLEAIAFDNEGASTRETISFTISADNGGDNQAPIVSFDQPNDGQTFTEGTNLSVQVSASDSDGSIASVEFFYDGVSQGTDNSAPYEWTVNNLAVGTFSLQAVATDDDGATASTTISINVEADIVDDGTPIVTISTPEDGAVFPAGTDLTVSASATDSDGTIRNIRLLLNGSTVRVIQAASGTWDANTDPALANLEAGSYELKVVAVDDAGNRGEDVHNITVRDGNQAPSLSFVNPTDGQDFPEGSNVVVEVSASDVDGSIDSVQLFLNSAFYRTETIAPYTWGASDQDDPEFANMSVGTYMLEAIAFDNEGASSNAAISFTISADNGGNQPPTVSFNTPTDGQTFTEGTAIEVEATANDADGSIAGVELFYDGISISFDDSSPYEWTIQNPSLGAHTLRVVATDNEGATAEQSIMITVEQGNTGGDDIPVVTIQTPDDGQVFAVGADLTVQASAVDPNGTIRNVRLFFDGDFIRTITGDSGTWDASTDPELANLSEGTHTVRVVAVDNNGNTGETTHTIEATSLFVSFIQPSMGETFPAGSDVVVEVEASDSDGSVSRVDLYLDGEFVRTESIPPYEWGLPNQNDPVLKDMAVGNYMLEAIATDNQGNTSSSITNFSVVESSLTSEDDHKDQEDTTKPSDENTRLAKLMNIPPVVTIQRPQDGATFPSGTNLTVEASATDEDGSIRNIRLYINDEFIRTIRGASGTWDASTDPELANLQVGTYEINVAAVDNRGASTEEIINITVVDDGVNVPPTVSFVTPTDGQTFPEGTNLFVEVAASDSDGTVSGVDLFLEGNFIRTEALAPYSWGEGTAHTDLLLQDLPVGTHQLRAVATDNEGATTESIISINVTGDGVNAPPTVSFASPVNGASFTEGDNLSVSVNATDAEGSVAQVELFYNGNSQGSDSNTPYNWTITNLAIGTHTLRAVATDDEGASNETSISITVEADNGGGNNGGDDQTVGGEDGIPITTIVSPRDGDVFPIGHDLTVVAEASDPDGSIRNVRMYLNGEFISKINNPPYTWAAADHPELANLQAGNYDIRVGAADNRGNSSELTITITVGEVVDVNQAPSVSFASPANGSSVFVGENVSVDINASDSDGTVTGVEFFYDGISQGTDSNAPYNWNITSITEGSHTLRAIATDNEGATSETTITISAIEEGQNTPPSISFSSPNDGDSFIEGDDVSVTVNASDADGSVSNVEFFYNGVSQGTDSSSPYNWTINNLTIGSHTLRAVATDDEGATSETTITISANEAGQNTPPSISFSSPNDGASFTEGDNLSVAVNASDADGSVSNVEFFYNGVSQGTDSSSPYNWTINSLAVGSHTLRAVATDNEGATSETSISITVNADNTGGGGDQTVGGENGIPITTIVSPRDGDVFPIGHDLTVVAEASDPDGRVRNVRMYLNGDFVSKINNPPYEWTGAEHPELANLQAGSYDIRVGAVDDRGNSSELTITITVGSDVNARPNVSFASPSDGMSFTTGDAVAVEINASDSDGTVTGVEFFYDGVSQGTDNSVPYNWTITDITEGSHTLRAIATDNEGATRETSISISAFAEGQNLAPSVSFDTPSNNQQFDEGHNLYVKASATDSDGTIASVELYFDGQFVRAEIGAPYEWGDGTNHTDNALRNLQPGTHSLRVVAIDNEGASAEQTISIRVNESDDGGGGGEGAMIAIENMTKTPFREESFPADDIYAFCLVGRPSQTMTDLHNRNRMRIHNTGTSNLVVSQINISDTSEYTLPNNEWASLPLIIPPNSSYDLLIQFVEKRGNRGFRGQSIELVSNAGNRPSITAELRGAFHPRAEGNSEPLVGTIIRTLGFKTDLGDRLNTGLYPDPAEVEQGLHGDIVLSEVWERADPNEPVIGFNLAVYKGGAQTNQGSGLNTRFVQTGSFEKVGNFSFNTCVGFHQSILSKNQNCRSYDLIGGVERQNVDEPFRIVMDGYITDGKGERDPVTNRRHLLAIRLFKVIDNDGVEIPNHYIAINDYVKNGCSEADGALPTDEFANCDWNDNIAYFVNIKPVNPIAIGGMSLAEVEERYGKIARQQELRAYPNPVQQSLNVDLSSFMGQAVTLYIQDQVGKVVRLEEFDTDHDATATLDMNNISNGFYILNLRAKDAQLSKKIIVSSQQ